MLNELMDELSFTARSEPKRDHHIEQFVSYILCIRLFGEPLSSNGLFRLSSVMSQYSRRKKSRVYVGRGVRKFESPYITAYTNNSSVDHILSQMKPYKRQAIKQSHRFDP
jgi:hypothetical protein